MAMQPPPPPAKGMTPQQYYAALQQQGLSPYQAYTAVQANYGNPQDYVNRQNAKQEQNSAIGQTLGSVGGLVVGQEAIRGFPNVRSAFEGNNFAESGRSGITRNVPTETLDLDAIGSSATPTIKEVGAVTMPDGTSGTLMSDGGKIGENGKIVNPDGSPGGSISGQALAGLQIAGGAAQAYNGYKQYQSGEKLGGAANIAGGAYNTAAGVQSLAQGGATGSLAQYAPAVGTAVAAAQIGQNVISDKGSSEDRAAKSQAEAQKAAMLWIPGYGWVAYAALAGLDAISGGKATEALMKYNKFNNKLTDKIDFGLGKNIRSKVFHQSTKGRQEERTGQLLQQSDDPNWQNYVASMRMQQIKEGPKDKTKPFFKGQYATFNEYKKAGLQADDLTGVYGNMDAFKPDYAEKAGLPNWANLSFEQRKAVTQRLINEDMYSSKKGDIVIGDKEKARRIYEDMAKTNFGISQPQSKLITPAVPVKGQVVRTSPGMYMNDKGRVAPAKTIREALENNYKAGKGK